MLPILEILKPGLLTLIEDLGRWGYQRYGVSACGAMDLFSHRVANRLVGNDEREATLECTVVGPRIKALSNTIVACTGADLNLHIDGHTAPMWTSVEVSEGSVVSFGAYRSGCRTYIAIHGGIAVREVLGSRSTHLATRLGGQEGRALQAGDVLCTDAKPPSQRARRMLLPRAIPAFESGPVVRVLLGPNEDFFRADSIERFFSEGYRISQNSDRMGIRLEGKPLRYRASTDIVSDSVPFGAVQVPPNGQPIILMADRPTTGGYPKIAHVITADSPQVAQLKPGDHIRFTRSSMEEALAALARMEETIEYSIVEIG
jgi:biotin-dependent carboxylase-like uncharacterized protein